MITARDKIIAALFAHEGSRAAARRLTAEGRTAFLGLKGKDHVGVTMPGVQDPLHACGVLVAYLMAEDDSIASHCGSPAVVLFTRPELLALGL